MCAVNTTSFRTTLKPPSSPRTRGSTLVIKMDSRVRGNDGVAIDGVAIDGVAIDGVANDGVAIDAAEVILAQRK